MKFDKSLLHKKIKFILIITLLFLSSCDKGDKVIEQGNKGIDSIENDEININLFEKEDEIREYIKSIHIFDEYIENEGTLLTDCNYNEAFCKNKSDYYYNLEIDENSITMSFQTNMIDFDNNDILNQMKIVFDNEGNIVKYSPLKYQYYEMIPYKYWGWDKEASFIYSKVHHEPLYVGAGANNYYPKYDYNHDYFIDNDLLSSTYGNEIKFNEDLLNKLLVKYKEVKQKEYIFLNNQEILSKNLSLLIKGDEIAYEYITECPLSIEEIIRKEKIDLDYEIYIRLLNMLNGLEYHTRDYVVYKDEYFSYYTNNYQDLYYLNKLIKKASYKLASEDNFKKDDLIGILYYNYFEHETEKLLAYEIKLYKNALVFKAHDYNLIIDISDDEMMALQSNITTYFSLSDNDDDNYSEINRKRISSTNLPWNSGFEVNGNKYVNLDESLNSTYLFLYSINEPFNSPDEIYSKNELIPGILPLVDSLGCNGGYCYRGESNIDLGYSFDGYYRLYTLEDYNKTVKKILDIDSTYTIETGLDKAGYYEDKDIQGIITYDFDGDGPLLGYGLSIISAKTNNDNLTITYKKYNINDYTNEIETIYGTNYYEKYYDKIIETPTWIATLKYHKDDDYYELKSIELE